MNKGLTVLGSLGLGAALMYMFDPDRGNRRRALMRDQLSHARRVSREGIDVMWRDTQNRARGVAYRARSLVSRQPIPDDLLEKHIRAQLGRVVSHPGSIEIAVNQGRVAVAGPILQSEVPLLLGAVWRMRGVKDVQNQLEVHERPDVPGLQGSTPRTARQTLFKRETWTPAERLVVGTTGTTLAFYSMARHPVGGPLLTLVGLGMLARAAANRQVGRMVGLGGRQAVEVHKRLTVNAPVEEVYRFWSDYENFPRFVRNVKEVTRTGENTSHWKVAGPAGSTVEWDAVTTQQVPNEVLAWKTVEGSMVENQGTVRFEPDGMMSTRLDIRMSYSPPAGALGHIVASLFGANPKREMDEDLMRMKSFLETGKAARDAAVHGTTAESRGGISPGLAT